MCLLGYLYRIIYKHPHKLIYAQMLTYNEMGFVAGVKRPCLPPVISVMEVTKHGPARVKRGGTG